MDNGLRAKALTSTSSQDRRSWSLAKNVFDVLGCGVTLAEVSPHELKALKAIRGYASANRVILTGHANRRLRERGGVAADAVHALANATCCVDQRQDRNRAGDWRSTGPDTEGDPLTCSVILEGGVLVVTVF